MQPAEARDPLGGRAQVEVVGVAEDHLGTRGLQVGGRQRLDRGLGADRHELGRLDRPVRGLDAPQARAADAGRREGVSDRGGR